MSEPLADAIALDPLEALVPGPALPLVELTGEGSFTSAFDVNRAVFTASAAANAAFGTTTLDRRRAVALCSGRCLLDGEAVPSWADLSGYYETSEGGHIQFHCNFAHHAAGIVAELGCEPDKDSMQAAVLRRDADELETTLIDRGLIAARLRTLEEWSEHPHAAATDELPLITVERIAEGTPRDADRRLRVLDCSRVLAGPVAGMTFAAHGADTLRVGSEHLPSVQGGVLTTGSGKRNAFVELDLTEGPVTMRQLLDGADVWIDAYRPGSFTRRGFAPESVASGTVIVQLCAFDQVGPWAGRRGFDSIVQSTTGIVRAGSESAGNARPTPPPVQALDYCTGLLAAFAGRRLAEHQADAGGTWLARLSLLRTRNWLVAMGGPKSFAPKALEVDPDAMHTITTAFGELTTALPISGSWPHGPTPLGSSPPVWLDR